MKNATTSHRRILLPVLLLMLSICACKGEEADPYIDSVAFAPSQGGSVVICNPNGKAFEVSGWTLRDPLQPLSFTFPGNTLLPPLSHCGWSDGFFPFDILDTVQTIQLLDPSGSPVHSYTKE